jgi:hypothetical protein
MENMYASCHGRREGGRSSFPILALSVTSYAILDKLFIP